MSKLKTGTRSFDCPFFVPMGQNRIQFVVIGVSLVEAATIFGSADEMETIQMYGNIWNGYTHVIGMSPEADGIRVTMGREGEVSYGSGRIM